MEQIARLFDNFYNIHVKKLRLQYSEEGIVAIVSNQLF